MNELDQAIQAAGGVSALAKAIGVPRQNTISMWRKRGSVPLPWQRIIRSEILKQKQPEALDGQALGAITDGVV